MALPTAVEYGTVSWRALSAAADGVDVDGLPDAVPVTGTVTFTPSARVMLAINEAPPVTVFATPVTYDLDNAGVLRDSEGRDDITLVATDSAGLTPVGWTWTCSYRLNGGLVRGSFSFALPADEHVDLTTVAPVASAGGVSIIQGPAGPTGPQGPPYTDSADEFDDAAAALVEDATSATAAALLTRYASLEGFVFDPLAYGAVGDGTTDDTTAVQAAVAAAKAVHGAVVFRRMFLVNTTIVQDDNFALLGIGSNVGLKAGASMPADAPLLWTMKSGSSTAVIEGHMYGAKIDGIRLDGNARTVACKGWQIDVVTGCDFRNVQIRHFAQEGMLLSDSVRESDWYHVHVRGCGDAALGYAAVAINHNSTKDGHNNLHFYGLYAIFSYGIGLQIKPTNDTSPSRGLVFDSPMVHGMLSSTTTNDDLTMVPDWRSVATPLVEIADARTVLMNTPRLHRSGYGQPLMLIRNNEGVALTQNSVTLVAPALGTSQDATGTVTATAATDLLTSTGIKLGTGAMVRFTTTGTLPAGLSLLTDYYAIRVTDDTFKVATSRALAEAGTAVDITGTGTGTHTVTAQSMSVLIEAASNPTLRVIAPYITDTTPNRAVVVNKAGNGKVVLSATGTQSGVTFFEPFSSTDSATGAFSDITILTALQTSDATAINNSNVLVTSGVLTLTLDAGATYAFDGLINYDCSTTADLKLAWSVPSLATGYWTPDGLHTSVSSNSGSIQRLRTDLATSQAVGGAGAGTTVAVKVAGTITTGASGGAFAMKYAQNTAEASDLVIRAGSYLTARRLA